MSISVHFSGTDYVWKNYRNDKFIRKSEELADTSDSAAQYIKFGHEENGGHLAKLNTMYRSMDRRDHDSMTGNLSKTGTKVKRGLAGYANGARISAMADTGSRKNVISAAYAARLGLKAEGLGSSFTLGSSRQAHSIGTVSLLWSFAENPEKTIPVICHVLPRCIYNLILGNGFLTETETMSRYRHRLTQCLFSMVNSLSPFAFLGETCQRLQGTLADIYDVYAVPDSGAERNVMSLQYAIRNNLRIKTGSRHRNWLQFADESFEETVGQVTTYWTFATGKRIPMTFEILENCCSDVIIGEDILTQYNVFEDHASSFVLLDASSDTYELAPFDFVRGWQQALSRTKGRKPKEGKDGKNDRHIEEQRRRDLWNYEHDFGANASTGEKDMEKARRSIYNSAANTASRIPSISTAPSQHLASHRPSSRSES